MRIQLSHFFQYTALFLNTNTVLFTVTMARQKIPGIKKSCLQWLSAVQAFKKRKLNIDSISEPTPEPIPTNEGKEDKSWYFNDSSDNKGFDSSKKEEKKEENNDDDWDEPPVL